MAIAIGPGTRIAIVVGCCFWERWSLLILSQSSLCGRKFFPLASEEFESENKSLIDCSGEGRKGLSAIEVLHCYSTKHAESSFQRITRFNRNRSSVEAEFGI